jgi:hypothetical protein
MYYFLITAVVAGIILLIPLIPSLIEQYKRDKQK